MNRLEFSINIDAEKSKIWKALWDDSSYRDWAGVFFEGSYAKAENWDEGCTVHFLAPDQSGIYSLIETHIPNSLIRFKHIGSVVDGKEQLIDDASKKWTGATEIYRITKGKNTNILEVEIDVMDEHLDFMKSTFPKALEKIKENCS